MATSPMRPQLRKKPFWNENKENKPSPLIEVPPLGPTPMFANSNVSIHSKISWKFFSLIITMFKNNNFMTNRLI